MEMLLMMMMMMMSGCEARIRPVHWLVLVLHIREKTPFPSTPSCSVPEQMLEEDLRGNG